MGGAVTGEIMGVMSGCQGYRALEDFVIRHQAVLLELMELPQERLPSYSTLRRIMIHIDFRAFACAFNAWAKDTFTLGEHEHLSTDGKSTYALVEPSGKNRYKKPETFL